MRLRKIFISLLVMGLIFSGIRPVNAQEDDPPLPGEPGFSDGVWGATLVSSGPVTMGQARSEVVVSGGGLISVIEGKLTGKYRVSGNENLTVPGGGGVATMTSIGEWVGNATKPAMASGQTVIEGTITIDGASQNVSFSLPATDQITVIPIISASCTVVVGDWPYVANNAFAGTGASPSLGGAFVAIRLLDALPGEEPPSYLEDVLALHTDGLLFYANVVDTGVVDYGELDALMERTEDYYDLLQRSAACEVGEASGWLGMLAGMVYDLLQYALDNPAQFDNMDLLRLVTTGVRMGIIGTGTPATDGLLLLNDGLVLDLKSRTQEVEDNNDCDGGLSLLALASLLGDGAAVADVAHSVGRVCGGG